MSLSVEFMGRKLKNPVIVAAGPWARNSAQIKAAFSAGAGGFVTETISTEPNSDVSPRFAFDGRGLQNIRLYSHSSLEKWLTELEIAQQEKPSEEHLIIGSIMAQTPSEMRYIARKVERAGADALELGIACPMGEGAEIIASNPDRIYELTKAAADSVDIPVMVKFNHIMPNISTLVEAVESAGGAGISAIDTVRSILKVDLAARQPVLATYGGYSGAPIKPLGLAAIAGISQCTNLPTCGIGGIETGADALEYIMLGATAIQVGTAVLLYGMSVITEIIAEIERWMKDENVLSLTEIQGQAMRALKSFEEIKQEPNRAVLVCPCNQTDCNRCIQCCTYHAIARIDGKLQFLQECCTGCGLCRDLCPNKMIELEWL